MSNSLDAKTYIVELYNKTDQENGAFSDTNKVEMTLEDILNIKDSNTTFKSFCADNITVYSALIGTDNLAVLAEYLIEPYEKGYLSYPLAVYLLALSDDLFEVGLDFNLDATSEAEAMIEEQGFVDYGELKYFNIKTVRIWVERRLIAYREEASSKESLISVFTNNRLKHLLADVKLKLGEDSYSFLAMFNNTAPISLHYSRNLIFHEMQDRSEVVGNTHKALFRLAIDPHKKMFETVDSEIPKTL